MRVTLLRRLRAWIPPVVLMAAIFVLSAQPDPKSGLGAIDLVGRKLVHFAEYSLLAFLWWRALVGRTASASAPLAALLMPSAYAASDEYHQSFVAGRHASPVDWAIDVAGAATAIVAVRRFARARTLSA